MAFLLKVRKFESKVMKIFSRKVPGVRGTTEKNKSFLPKVSGTFTALSKNQKIIKHEIRNLLFLVKFQIISFLFKHRNCLEKISNKYSMLKFSTEKYPNSSKQAK